MFKSMVQENTQKQKVYDRIKWLNNQVEIGDSHVKRERAYKKLVELISWAKKNITDFSTPWYVYA